MTFSEKQKKIIYWIVTGYLTFILLLFVFQRALVFQPETNYYTPQELELWNVGVHTIETDDKLKLEGWHFASTNKQAPLILFFHGNTGDITDRIEVGKKLNAQGIDVFMPIYRGYSGMPGHPSKKALYKDGRQWVEFVKNKYPDKDLIFHGRSLGSAVASKMAAEYEAKALILEVPFTRVTDVAQKRYPIVPVSLLTIDRFDNVKNLQNVEEPTFFITARRDRVVPYTQGQKLYEGYKGEKEYYNYPGGEHTGLYKLGLAKKVKDYLSETLSKAK